MSTRNDVSQWRGSWAEWNERAEHQPTPEQIRRSEFVARFPDADVRTAAGRALYETFCAAHDFAHGVFSAWKWAALDVDLFPRVFPAEALR